MENHDVVASVAVFLFPTGCTESKGQQGVGGLDVPSGALYTRQYQSCHKFHYLPVDGSDEMKTPRSDVMVELYNLIIHFAKPSL